MADDTAAYWNTYLDFSEGIRKPAVEQAGYIAVADGARNLTYVAGGAVNRVIDVVDYIVASGVAEADFATGDCHAGWLAALAAATAAGGGLLYFRAGTYRMVGTMTIGVDNIVVAGAGADVTTILAAADQVNLEITAASSVCVRDLTLDGAHTTHGTNSENAVEIVDSADVLISNVRVYDSCALGMYVYDDVGANTRVVLDRLRFEDTGSDSLYISSDGVLVSQVCVTDSGNNSITLAGDGNRVSQADLSGSGYDALNISGSDNRLSQVSISSSGNNDVTLGGSADSNDLVGIRGASTISDSGDYNLIDTGDSADRNGRPIKNSYDHQQGPTTLGTGLAYVAVGTCTNTAAAQEFVGDQQVTNLYCRVTHVTNGGAPDTAYQEVLEVVVARDGASYSTANYTLKNHSGGVSGPSTTPSLTGYVLGSGRALRIRMSGGTLIVEMQQSGTNVDVTTRFVFGERVDV